MKIFIVTDNKFWLEKVTVFFKNKNMEVGFYCSPKGKKLFENELKSGVIKVLDVNKEFKYLISHYNVGFSCHCKQIFPKVLVESVRCINIHPGLNPHNRGWFPQVFSIINKKPAGATIHLMDSEVDHGAILVQEHIKVYDWENSKDIYERILEAEYKLFENHFDKLVDLEFEGTPMGDSGNYNSIKDYKDLLEIDLKKEVTMAEAIDYLRAMTHPPYENCFFKTKDDKKVYLSINLSLKDKN